MPAERTGSIAYLRENPLLGAGIICAGSLAAFGYNMSVFIYTMVAQHGQSGRLGQRLEFWPPRAHQTASDGLRLPTVLGR